MMKMLTGQKILDAVKTGQIYISPFNPQNINPNSYNLTLGDKIMEVVTNKDGIINPREKHEVIELTPVSHDEYVLDKLSENDRAFLLKPGKLYLASTVEETGTDLYVPMLSGRSSMARCGVQVHMTAGFGDIGFRGTWTLEIAVVYPTILIAGMQIAQVYFEEPYGDAHIKYNGKYQGQKNPQISRFYREL